MNFIKRIIAYFKPAPMIAQPSADASNPGLNKLDKRPKPSIAKEVQDDIYKAAGAKPILDDLNTIEPVSKQFEKDQADLINELKKLDPRDHRS